MKKPTTTTTTIVYALNSPSSPPPGPGTRASQGGRCCPNGMIATTAALYCSLTLMTVFTMGLIYLSTLVTTEHLLMHHARRYEVRNHGELATRAREVSERERYRESLRGGVSDDDDDDDDTSTRTTSSSSSFIANLLYDTVVDRDERFNALSPGRTAEEETVAERTTREFWERGAWYNESQRYLVYQPSGGLSNQRIQIETALLLGRLLNRIVIIPPLGPHTSMWWNYNKVALGDLLPADELLDARAMNRFARVMILRGITFKRFLEMNEDEEHKHRGKPGGPARQSWLRIERDNVMEKRNNLWPPEEIKKRDDPSAVVLFYARGSIWQSFTFSPEDEERAVRAARLSPEIRHLARLVSHDVALAYDDKGRKRRRRHGKEMESSSSSSSEPLTHHPYNAIHIRFMDGDGTDLREGLLRPATSFVWRMRKFNDTIPLYVATVPSKRGSPYFKPMAKKFRLMFGEVLEGDPRVGAFLDAHVRARSMRDTVLGVIEQLICARAERFVGTGFSTFSEYIRRMRRWREDLVYDELIDRHGPGGERAFEREMRYAKTVTPCLKATWAC